MKRPSVFHNLYVVGSVDRALFERVKSVRSSCFRRYMYVSDLFSDVTYICFRRFRRFRRFVFLFTVNSIISDALISIPVNSIISNGLISMISEIRLHIDFPELQPQLTVTLNSMISLPGSFSDDILTNDLVFSPKLKEY